MDLFHLINHKGRGFSWVIVLSPRHVSLMGYFWILDILEKGSSSSMCLSSIHKLLFSLSTIIYWDLLVDTRDHKIVDSVSVLSCKVTKGDIASFSSLDSRDGFGNKDAISVASDLKVFLNGPIAVRKLYTEEVRSVHSDDEEYGKKKRKKITTWYLQKQETVVLYSCEAEFMDSTKMFGRFKFKEIKNLIGVQDFSKCDFKLMGKNVGLSLKENET